MGVDLGVGGLVWGVGKGAQPLGEGRVGFVCRAGRQAGWWRGAGPAPVALSPSASCSSSCSFIYELEHFNGVAELLEILGR